MKPKKQTYTKWDIECFDIPNSAMTSDEYDERLQDDPGGWSQPYTEAELEELLKSRMLGNEDSDEDLFY